MGPPITEPTARVPRERSPSYPGIPLPTAVERARVAYGKFRQFEQPVKTFTEAWGYKSATTGPATVTFAALKKYGLIEDEGSGAARTAKLTQLAVDILMKQEHAAEIQKAALLPPIHLEMWERFGNDVPEADALRYEFVTQRGFSDTGLVAFLREYRETIAFAKLGSSGTLTGESHGPDPEERHDKREDEDDEAIRKAAERKAQRERQRGLQGRKVLSYAVPVAAGTDVTVEGNFPLSEAEWTQFLAVLTAMKPGLVGERPAVPDEPEDE